MNCAIVYYSYTGNTRKVAAFLKEALTGEGRVEIIELKAQDETTSFLGQARRALVKKRAKISPAKFDLSGYDLVCFGTPVWAFAPAPAMNTYLDKCTGLKDKKVILFATYGSGLGKGPCLNYMQKILKKKGAREFKKFFIQQLKTDDRQFILSCIKESIAF